MLRRLPMVALSVVVACDQQGSARNSLVAPQPLPHRGARVYVVEEAFGGASKRTFTVHVDTRDIALGAYSGTIDFDSEGIVLVGSSVPADGMRLVNLVAPGVVKFAGFATKEFTGTVAATLTLRSARAIDATALHATLDVVGDVDGIAAPRTQLIEESRVFSAALAIPR